MSRPGMYGISKDLLDLFANFDVLVFVDDWRGPDPRDQRAPVFLIGRSFLRRDFERLGELLRLLQAGNAMDWHARKGRSLFKSEVYDDIVQELEWLRSSTYSLNAERVAFETALIREQWESIRASSIGKAWDTDAPHAKALFAYLNRLGHRLNRELPRGLRFRVVVDRVDWRMRTANWELGLATFGAAWDGRGDVWTIVDRDRRDAKRFLPVLGLVDSEAWAWGRLQTRKLPSGDTVRQRMLNWLDSGAPDVLLFTEADVARLELGELPNLVDYWRRLGHWQRLHRHHELTGSG